jgi:hypothetical protein
VPALLATALEEARDGMSSSEEQGRWAEQYIAERFDLEHCPDEASWYDCINPRTGTKHEVKSTHVDAAGEFRLWEDQTRSLIASDAQGTAWFDFVLLDRRGNVLNTRRMRPSTVNRLVRERGGWYEAGHHDRPGRQHKLPASELF